MATAFKQLGNPPQLPFIDPADMPETYAAPAYGRCMEPEITDGTLLVFTKSVLPLAGDTVVIFFRREHAELYGAPGWVKRLMFALPPEGMAGLVVVEQLNPPLQLVVPTAHIAAVHKCVGTARNTGPGRAVWNPSKKEEA